MRLVRHVVWLARRFASCKRRPHIAVVGSGPAGLYVCASALRRLDQCQIDVFESNRVPYGLIRYGIAPDHPEMKNCINQFDKMFSENQDRLSLLCNVIIGKDIEFSELCADYDAVVLAYGARKQRKLKIPGEDAANVFSGGNFVSWYNGMWGAKEPQLDCKTAVIIGNGNVALDCGRILLSSHSEQLAQSDMPSPILKHLSNSTIKEVVIIGRRGFTNVSFTIKELREQTRIENCDFSVELADNERTEIESQLQSFQRPRKRITELLLKHCKETDASSDLSCRLLFQKTPIKILADVSGRVNAVQLKNNLSDQDEVLQCGLLIYSLGFESVVLDGVPINSRGELDMLDKLRVRNVGNTLLYAAGWCAQHSPRGLIVNTQMDASNVAERLCADIEKIGVSSEDLSGSTERLQSRSINYVSWYDWKQIDQEECNLGARHGKKREKLANINKFLSNNVESAQKNV